MILMLFTQLYWSLIHDNIRLSSIQRMSKEDWTPYYLVHTTEIFGDNNDSLLALKHSPKTTSELYCD